MSQGSRDTTIDLKSFEFIPHKGCYIPGLSEASLVVYKDDMYLFGGGNAEEFSSEVFRFDFKHRSWSRMPIYGISPAGRSQHVAAVYGNEMFIYGGAGTQSVVYNDFYAFNFETHTWRNLLVNSKVQPRRLHSAVVWGNRMYIFGGEIAGKVSNELWVFNFTTHKWDECRKGNADTPKELRRHSHTSVVYKDSIAVYGGFGEEGGALQDIWLFNVTNQTWTEHTQLKLIMGRKEHASVILNGNMYIVAGINSTNKRCAEVFYYSFSLHSWMEEKTKAFQSQSGKDDFRDVNGELVYYNPNVPVSALASKGTAEAPEAITRTFSARNRHRAVLYHGDMYIFGGHDGTNPLNEVFRYIITPPSTLMEDMLRTTAQFTTTGKGDSSSSSSSGGSLSPMLFGTECYLHNATTAFPVVRFVVQARFPPLLPYLSDTPYYEKSGGPAVGTVQPEKVLPYNDYVIVALLTFIYTDTLPDSFFTVPKATTTSSSSSSTSSSGPSPATLGFRLTLPDIVSLVEISELCGCIHLKYILSYYLINGGGSVDSVVDYTSLQHLLLLMTASRRYGLIHVERKCLHYFVTLLPFSLSILSSLPHDCLVHYSTIITRLLQQSQEDNENLITSVYGTDMPAYVEQNAASSSSQPSVPGSSSFVDQFNPYIVRTSSQFDPANPTVTFGNGPENQEESLPPWITLDGNSVSLKSLLDEAAEIAKL